MKPRFKINKHHNQYDKATEHALRAIYEGSIIKISGQEISYDREKNELTIKDFYGSSIYKPSFNGIYCDPFKELIRKEV